VFGLFVFPNTKRENRRPPGNSPESDKSLVLRVISAHKKDRRYPTLLHQKASQNEMQRVVESLLFKEYRLKLIRNGQIYRRDWQGSRWEERGIIPIAIDNPEAEWKRNPEDRLRKDMKLQAGL
jgi:hypothetical protein